MTPPSVRQFLTLAYVPLTATVADRRWKRLESVSGHAQKAVLVAIAARCGRVVGLDRLSTMAGCSRRQTMLAVRALVEQGLVRYRLPVPPSRRSCAFEIDWTVVAAMTPQPQGVAA